jgi:hypothetical protein
MTRTEYYKWRIDQMSAFPNPGMFTLALGYARKAAKANLLAQGRKLQSSEAREINFGAKAYLDAHPELMEQAAETIRRSPALLKLSQRWRAFSVNRAFSVLKPQLSRC